MRLITFTCFVKALALVKKEQIWKMTNIIYKTFICKYIYRIYRSLTTYMYCRCVYYIEASTEIITDNIVRGMANVSCHNMISYFPNGYSSFQYMYMYCHLSMLSNYPYSLHSTVNYKTKKKINHIKVCFFRSITMVMFPSKNM